MSESSTFDHLSTVNLLTNLASKYHIKQWDFGAGSSTDTSVQVDNGSPKQLKSSQRTSITLRVWNQAGLVGITSTSDTSKNGLQKAFLSARLSSEYGNKDDIPNFSPLSKAKLPDLNLPVHSQRGIKTLLASLREAESSLLRANEFIKSVPYNGITESISERLYINSDGAFRQAKRSQTSIYLYARAEQLNKKPRSGSSVKWSLGFDQLDINGCIQEALDKTISHLDYQPVKTGSYLICFSPESILDLLGSFSSMFNARSIIDGLSLSNKDSIGETISVPTFNLIDNAIDPSNLSSIGFDGEGTPYKSHTIIEDGILKNLLHSESTAREFRVDPTGHAGIGSKVSVGPEWLQVFPSTQYKSENINLNHNDYSQEFILIDNLNALHAGIKPSQGSFSLPFDGWICKDGEKFSIEAATVAGDIKHLLKSILNIESESKITTQGISPYIWVEGLSITGEK